MNGPVGGAPQTVAGRFELHQRIASGGMGTVWCAWDRKHRRWVAAKVLTHTDAGMLLRFVREQSLRIRHPHVATPTGWAADDDRVVLSMDLVRGGSLETLLGDHGALPEAYEAVLLDQLLSALSAVHAIGVVHRDIKPANVLLEPTGTGRPHLRLSDFGVAAVVDEPRLTHASMSLGTTGYMSPEQAAGAEPDAPQDLYAVGVLGRHLLSGAPLRRLPADHPSALWPFLLRLSAPDPADRPTAAAALSELRSIGVPDGAPWQDRVDAPEVFEQIPDPQRIQSAPVPSPPPAFSPPPPVFSPPLPVIPPQPTRAPAPSPGFAPPPPQPARRPAAPPPMQPPAPLPDRPLADTPLADRAPTAHGAETDERRRWLLRRVVVVSFGLAALAVILALLLLLV